MCERTLAAVRLWWVVTLASLSHGLVEYSLSAMTGAGLAKLAVSNQSACVSLCNASGPVGAVSYSDLLKECVTSVCAMVNLVPNALWTTFVCLSKVVSCNIPKPRFEWMMTDACGFANTGWDSPGLPLVPSYNFKPFSVNFSTSPSLSPYFGNPVAYPAAKNYFSFASYNSFLDMSQSLTVFSYFYSTLEISSTYFAFIEFGNLLATDYFWVPHFWIDNGGAFCSGGDKVLAINPFKLQPNTWSYVAFVLDGKAKTYKGYVNGTLMNSDVFSPGTYRFNTIFTGGRPTSSWMGSVPFGAPTGTTYCLKVFQAALSITQILNVAQSCIHGYVTKL